MSRARTACRGPKRWRARGPSPMSQGLSNTWAILLPASQTWLGISWLNDSTKCNPPKETNTEAARYIDLGNRPYLCLWQPALNVWMQHPVTSDPFADCSTLPLACMGCFITQTIYLWCSSTQNICSTPNIKMHCIGALHDQHCSCLSFPATSSRSRYSHLLGPFASEWPQCWAWWRLMLPEKCCCPHHGWLHWTEAWGRRLHLPGQLSQVA